MTTLVPKLWLSNAAPDSASTQSVAAAASSASSSSLALTWGSGTYREMQLHDGATPAAVRPAIFKLSARSTYRAIDGGSQSSLPGDTQPSQQPTAGMHLPSLWGDISRTDLTSSNAVVPSSPNTAPPAAATAA